MELPGRSIGARAGLAAGLVLLGLADTGAQRPGGSSTYTGPLIDSHAHIVNYRPLVQGEGVVYRVDPREAATTNAADTYVAGLDRNNIKCVVAFHGIALDDKRDELLSSARRFRERYPARFVLLAEFFRDTPLDWFDAARLMPFFDDALFAGFGEIQFANPLLGDNKADIPIVPPNDDRFMAIYDLIGERRQFVMAHPASLDGVAEGINRNPNAIWLTHGPQMHRSWTRMEDLDAYLETHPNLYYTVDFSESLPEFLKLTKAVDGAQSLDEFLRAMDANSSSYLRRMVTTWTAPIEAHPGRFMWGTDMARPAWHWDAKVIDAIARFSRSFIGALDPAVAEKFAYRNAEALFGPCPAVATGR